MSAGRGDAELEALLAPLRDGPVALSGVAEAGARRERLLPAMRAEVERAPGRLRRARLVRRATWGVSAGGALAAAALALVMLRGGATTPRPASLHIEPLGPRALTFIDATGVRSEIASAAAITAPGELVTAPASWSRLSTARGVQVQIAPRTRLRVTAVDERAQRSGLRLEQGEVHCRVPKLGPSEQFSIDTPEANVIVHGTVFSVRVGAASATAAAATCVRVSEGLVEVRTRTGSVRLGPGTAWGCEDDGAAEPPRIAARAPRERSAARPHARRHTRSVEAEPARRTFQRLPDGTLDEENELLAAALSAERALDAARARALFSALIERHPASPLVPEARAGLARTE